MNIELDHSVYWLSNSLSSYVETILSSSIQINFNEENEEEEIKKKLHYWILLKEAPTNCNFACKLHEIRYAIVLDLTQFHYWISG